MEIFITQSDGTMTARLVGRLDTPAAAEVSQKVQPLLDNADQTIVLDCSELTYISSSGLRIFLTIRKAAVAQGGKVVIEGLSTEIRQVFMMTGFLQLFEIV
ncbi:MAG: STAS domain-containing protein [Bacteroidales bacterium]|jgi:anti-sigma B factor antagonist|nr:STAS domain-containing protein [Bacteroidales bacterium]